MKINWRKVLLAGLVANMVSYLFGGGGYYIFKDVFMVEPTIVWKWTPQQALVFSNTNLAGLVVGNFVLAVVVAVIFAVLYDGLPGRRSLKGAALGIILWAGGILPAIFTMWFFTIIAPAALWYFMVQALVEMVIYGAVIAVIYQPLP